MDIDREQQQRDANSAEWYFIGCGETLHAFVVSDVAACGRVGAALPGEVWVDAPPCRPCLAVVRRWQAKEQSHAAVLDNNRGCK